jgi:putative peptide zinc metalloprotease protein
LLTYGDDEGGPPGHPSSSSFVCPALAAGVELIGRYHGSGLDKPIYLVRRGDGRVIQMTAVLFAVVSAIDGQTSVADIARQASAQLGRHLSAEDAGYLIEAKLDPSGLIGKPGDKAPATPAAPPILGLKMKARVVPARIVSMLTRLTLWTFLPPIVLPVLVLTAVFDRWLFFQHGLANATQQLIFHPSLALTIVVLTVLSTAFHEIGHATACRYGGARPGPIGVGLYIAWPVFYSDVTDTYRLGRAGRLRTDLGGVYFNVIAALLVAGAYFETGFEPLLLAVVLIQVDALHQFFPFFRLDGYYVASDLIGVPDLFMRMRPMLLSFIPGRPMHPQVKALKPWARYALATWVYLTFAVIAYLYFLLFQALPRVLATAGASFMLHLTEIGYYWHHGPPGYVALAIVDELTLVFPLVILALTAVMVFRLLRKLWSKLGTERPTKRVAIAAAAATLLLIPLPNVITPAAYRPITPSDRGTLPGPTSLPQQLTTPLASPRPFAQPTASPSPTMNPSPSPSPTSGGTTDGSTGGASPSPSPTSGATSPSPSSEPSPSPSPSPSTQPSPTPSPT